MRIYQNTASSFDTDAIRDIDLADALEANQCFAKLASAQGSHQHDNNVARKESELEPAELDWAQTQPGEWEATDEELNVVYRVSECTLY